MADHHEKKWVVYTGGEGPGHGKHIVLIAGDEEYRSEEGLPQLGKILSTHHGFKCTVVFSQNPETGEIDPNNQNNIPGLEALNSADLMIIATRFRNLPDDQMKHIDAYIKSGKPIVGMRTATHAFNIPQDRTYHKYSFAYGGEDYKQGFGRQVLGETWINHHGGHKSQSTGGIIAEGAGDHPIVRGIKDRDIWGPTDVYGVRLPLPGDSQPIILGQVLNRGKDADTNNRMFGMTPDDEPAAGKKNDPMMPVAWTKTYDGGAGKTGRAFTTTMGSSTDLESAGTRRMIVNGAYWALGMEDKIPAGGTKVDIVGEYKPTAYGFGSYTKGVKPGDHAMD